MAISAFEVRKLVVVGELVRQRIGGIQTQDQFLEVEGQLQEARQPGQRRQCVRLPLRCRSPAASAAASMSDRRPRATNDHREWRP